MSSQYDFFFKFIIIKKGSCPTYSRAKNINYLTLLEVLKF